MAKAHRCILIDAHKREVREVACKGLEDYYQSMNVERIETATWLDKQTCIYVDEEGLINGTRVGFVINNRPFAGSGIVTAINHKTGGSISLKEDWTAEGIARKVMWINI